MQCRNRYQYLDTENEEDAGRGAGSSLGRSSGEGPSVLSWNPERSRPDNAGLSDVFGKGTRGGEKEMEGNPGHRRLKLLPMGEVCPTLVQRVVAETDVRSWGTGRRPATAPRRADAEGGGRARGNQSAEDPELQAIPTRQRRCA